MLDNGDCLETGIMLNPDTGKQMAYEELWRVLPLEGREVVLLESVGPENKTFLGRIGKWFQGIGTTDGNVVQAKRSKLVNGRWEDVFVMGEEKVLPVIQAQMKWKEGDEVEIDGRSWKVLDLCTIV
jgi:Protein HRI1